MTPQPRCINIDWLEMYVYEPAEPRDIEYFGRLGYFCKDRGYGTKHWSQVFTVYDERGEEFMEVRRAPRHGAQDHHTIYPDNACNLRLVNRYCYFDTAAWIMSDFIEKHRYQVRRIYRIDLAIDFKMFDSGDTPRKVLRRIVNHKYAKIYQASRAIHGEDRWNQADDNSISWGKRKSMVVTRFYNKSLELAAVKDKPWIREAWFRAGLIADPFQPYLLDKDGHVIGDEVWRLEFQINSSARGWFVIDGDTGDEYVEHTLECYWNRPMLQTAIANLIAHYFQFRIYRQGIRKYDCPEKKLFDFSDADQHYLLRRESVKRVYADKAIAQIRWLTTLRNQSGDMELRDACDKAIRRLKLSAVDAWRPDEGDTQLLRLRMMLREPDRKLTDTEKKELRDLFI